MLVYLETGRTEIHIPVIFSFIPFCRQSFKQDKRFNSISGHVHRYPLFLLPAQWLNLLFKPEQTANQGGLLILWKGNELSEETPRGSLKQPVMGDLNNRKDMAGWDFGLKLSPHDIPVPLNQLHFLLNHGRYSFYISYTFPKIKSYNWFIFTTPRAINSAWNLMQHFVNLANGIVVMWNRMLWSGLVCPFQIWVENVSLKC